MIISRLLLRGNVYPARESISLASSNDNSNAKANAMAVTFDGLYSRLDIVFYNAFYDNRSVGVLNAIECGISNFSITRYRIFYTPYIIQKLVHRHLQNSDLLLNFRIQIIP